MLIAVDGFEAAVHARVGVGRFEVDLLKTLHHIVEMGHAPSLRFRIYMPDIPTADMPKPSNYWQYRICSFKRLWSQVALPVYLAIDRPKPDVFFSPVHYAPRICSSPLVLGIMDLSFIHFPSLFRKRDLYKLVNWTAYSVKKAKKIVAISQATKDDIIENYKIEPEKVVVVHPGVSMSTVNSQQSTEEIKKKYDIHGKYILYVGTLQPRKNLVRLIEAFNHIKVETGHAPSLQLVIVGKKGWMYEGIFAKVKELGLEKEVVFAGYVPDEDLPALYKGTTCFVLVSLYEGFGFPVLEALSYGVPVVCSNVSSLPEIVGDAGVLVDPESVDEIAGGIEKVLTMNKEEIMKLRNEGIKQASKFSWEKAAKQTLAILEEVGGK